MEKLGQIGIVAEIDRGEEFPYVVLFRNSIYYWQDEYAVFEAKELNKEVVKMGGTYQEDPLTQNRGARSL